jgi:hypothetical protein
MTSMKNQILYINACDLSLAEKRTLKSLAIKISKYISVKYLTRSIIVLESYFTM